MKGRTGIKGETTDQLKGTGRAEEGRREGREHYEFPYLI